MTAIESGLAVAKWCGHKVRYHMSTLVSGGNPVSLGCYGDLRTRGVIKQKEAGDLDKDLKGGLHRIHAKTTTSWTLKVLLIQHSCNFEWSLNICDHNMRTMYNIICFLSLKFVLLAIHYFVAIKKSPILFLENTSAFFYIIIITC